MVFPSRHLCLIALLGTAFIPARGEVIDLTSETQTPYTFDPAKILATANRLIASGEKDASASLLQYAEEPPDPHIAISRENRNYYVAWLCLLIYDPKSGLGLPWPEFGGPAFPETGDKWDRAHGRMNSATWPRFPLALSRDVPFLLAPGYSVLAGVAEPGFMFLKRCQTNGLFHTTPYPVPMHMKAEAALNDLLSSPQWKALQWRESTSPTYLHANENREIKFLRQQVERIK